MKKPVDGGSPLSHSAFSGLSLSGLPNAAPPAPSLPPPGRTPPKDRGRVDIRREKAGRAGKTVTVISGFLGIGTPEKESLAKAIQRRCGCGGAIKEGNLEIQGDQREVAAEVLREAGFRPVFCGG